MCFQKEKISRAGSGAGDSFAVIKLFAVDFPGYGGEGPGAALPGSHLLSGLLAHLFPGNKLVHTLFSFQKVLSVQ